MSRFWKVLSLAVVLVAPACDEFATPAQLAAPQILAIRADPPAVAPGQSAAVTILVADPDGAVAEPDVTWAITATDPGSVPLGEVTAESAGRATYVAPAEVAEEPSFASISARVRIAERELVGLKLIGIIDLPIPVQNPDIVAFTAGSTDLLPAGELSLTAGDAVPLEIATSPDPAEAPNQAFTYAWYTTAGTIEDFQSNPVELVARGEPGPGWLFVVVRDGIGGVAWQAIRITVE